MNLFAFAFSGKCKKGVLFSAQSREEDEDIKKIAYVHVEIFTDW